MQQHTIDLLDQFYTRYPVAQGTPCTEQQLQQAEQQLNLTLDPHYRQFVLRYGGAMVGDRAVYAIHNTSLLGDNTDTMISLTQDYRLQHPNACAQYLFITYDAEGNPIAIDPQGQVQMYNHDEDKWTILALTFEQYVLHALDH